MTGAVRPAAGPPVGRTSELDLVAGLARAAAEGRSGALLIDGEAGVGKTELLRWACRQAAEYARVIWASCLPLASLTAPFGPLLAGFREWVAGPEDGIRRPDQDAIRAVQAGPIAFDRWLDAQCAHRPTLLVVDDAQWADQSSLDALMYVIAGPEQRPLAVLATIRAEEVGDGHPLRRWRADVRRLARVRELHLERLDRMATGLQLAGLLGRPPREALTDEVYARSAGNPYLTGLLVHGLSADTGTLPAGLPMGLRDALARAWHGLSPAARELTRLVAIAGRPQRSDAITAVADVFGVGQDVVPLLREAVDAGVLTVDNQGRYWFGHPLLAEVLVDGLLPEERRARHAAFAALIVHLDRPDGEDVADLADHYHRAGDSLNALQWALRAADAAQDAGGAAEMLRLLRRAYELLPAGSGAGSARIDLLHRIRSAAEHAGEHERELAAVDDLLAVLDRRSEPLVVADLLVRRSLLVYVTGRAFASLSEVREALQLAEPYADSPQYAWAMAQLAYAELWHALPTGPAHAEEAVRLARACGADKPLSYALTVSVMARIMTDRIGDPAIAQEARAAAVRARDFFAFVHATLWEANCHDMLSSPANLELLRRCREELSALGSPHCYVASLSAVEADSLLLVGDWRACTQRLRVALGATPGPVADVRARLAAARLACWQGRMAEARAHLARAEEIVGEQPGFLVYNFDAILAEIAVAVGDTDEAVTAVLAGVDRDVTPVDGERLLPFAARALADRAQQLRDHGRDPGATLTRLRDLRHRFPLVKGDSSSGRPMYGRQLTAMQWLYDAEELRARGDPAAGPTWCQAARACQAGSLAWDEAYAAWRAAQALLPDRSTRDAAETALRRAHELAEDLEAAPLQRDVAELARASRIPLSTVTVPTMPAGSAPVLPQLTAREREIVPYLLAGRTYRQIARSLVLSEKTVSVHISNMLRKTGTANRVELAELVRRLTG